MSSEGRDEVKLGSIRDQVSSWTAGDFDDKKTSTKSESKIGPHPLSSKRLIGPQRPVSPYQCTLTRLYWPTNCFCTSFPYKKAYTCILYNNMHLLYRMTECYSFITCVPWCSLFVVISSWSIWRRGKKRERKRTLKKRA